MNQDQKVGALIIVTAVSLMSVALLLSNGWGIEGVPLHLYKYWSEDEYGMRQLVLVKTGWVLAPLVLVGAYGVLRYLSVIPPIFHAHHAPQESASKKEQ